MAEPNFTIRQGDTASDLFDQLRDANNNPVNITGATVTLRLVPLEGGPALVDNAAATIVAPATGEVSRAWQAGETSDPGFYLGNWRVTFSTGKVQTFPNAGHFLVHISENAPTALGSLYLTVADLKDTLDISDLSYAHKDIARSVSAASRAVDAWTGRRFYLNPAAGNPANVQRLFTPTRQGVLALDDLAELTLVEASDRAGVWSTWTLGSDYLLEPTNAPADGQAYTRIRALERSSFIRDSVGFPYWPASVRVTGRWGWPTLPEEVVQATQIIATQLLRRVREAPFGIVGIGLEGEAIRLSKADPQIVQLLGHLRKRKGLVLA